MTHTGDGTYGDRVLESIAHGLLRGTEQAEHGGTFAPARDASALDASAPRNLPGRKPGTHLASSPTPTTGPGAVILDCGTSRKNGFTHVLLVSPAAKDVLGPHRASRLGEVLGTIAGVEGFEWEGIDHLHLRAPGFEHADLLREARVIVVQMLA